MDFKEETLKNKKKLIMALLELNVRNKSSSNYVWNERAIYMIESIYSFYDRLPKNESNIDIRDLMSLDKLSVYSRTCCFPSLRNYVNRLPGFNESREVQTMSTYESHGYLTMQVTETLSHWENFYVDKELKKTHIKLLGVKYFINKYKKEKYKRSVIYFKNGAMDLTEKAISIISEDLEITTFCLNQITNKTSIESRTLLIDEHCDFAQKISQEKIDFIFNNILPNFNFEEIKKMATDDFDILDSTEDHDEVRDLIELNYGY